MTAAARLDAGLLRDRRALRPRRDVRPPRPASGAARRRGPSGH
ncbi:hypothetical protein BN903_38 [Halorubrum sp. AJ67]|nr:hypothetical protein BN903_38 [Halorubrum sp. AJ67]